MAARSPPHGGNANPLQRIHPSPDQRMPHTSSNRAPADVASRSGNVLDQFTHAGLTFRIVRVANSSVLKVRVTIPGQRQATTASTRVRDLPTARAWADQFARTLITRLYGDQPPEDPRTSIRGMQMTLGEAFDHYRRRYLQGKAIGHRKNMALVMRLAEGIWKRGLRLIDIDQTTVDAYCAARTTGAYESEDIEGNSGPGQKVGAWQAHEDLKRIRVVLNALVKEKVKNGTGTTLLAYNPLHGLDLRKPSHAKRAPVADHDRFEAMLAVTDKVEARLMSHWRYRKYAAMPKGWLRAFLCTLRWTGRRAASVRGLRKRDRLLTRAAFVERASDLGLTSAHFKAWVFGTLFFDREFDKNARDTVAPISSRLAAVLEPYALAVPGSDEAWLWPSVEDFTRPANRTQVHRWLGMLEQEAQIDHLKWGMSHPWRRAFRSERRFMPPKLVALCVGWKVWAGREATSEGPYLQYHPLDYLRCMEYDPATHGSPTVDETIGGVRIPIPAAPTPLQPTVRLLKAS